MDGIRAQFAKLFSLREKYMSKLAKEVQLSDFSQKDANKSIEARKEGNQLYLQKDNHNRDVHRDILFQYSKSIAYAPVDSEELALAYSNRSALLLHLQRFEECLIDIEKSMQISQSDTLKAKLELRKEKCLELVKNSKQDKQVSSKKGVSKPSKTGKKNLPSNQNYEVGFNKMKPSSQMPVASDAVTAVYTETLGRHLVAARDIKAGEVIMIEKGYMCLPQNNHVHLVCTHCLKLAWNGNPCNNCAFAIYCSEECKKEAEDYHEVECALLPYMSFVMLEDYGLMNSMILGVRMLVKAIKKEGLDAVLNEAKVEKKDFEGMTVDGILHSDRFKAFYNLLSHQDSVGKMRERKNLGESKVIELMSKHTNIFDAAKQSNEGTIEPDVMMQLEVILGKLIDIIKVNAFTYHGHMCECFKTHKTECECDSSKGMVFASCASLINHSCAPNVCRMNIPKGKIVFYAFVPIKKGEQLCDSYGPTVGLPKEDRKKTLQKSFFFTCKCKCCEENWLEDGKKFNMSQKVEENIQRKMMNDFERSFPSGFGSSIFSNDWNEWTFDEEQLKMALKMTELTFKYYKDPIGSFTRSLHFRMYIDMAFNQIFGEKATISEKCLSV